MGQANRMHYHGSTSCAFLSKVPEYARCEPPKRAPGSWLMPPYLKQAPTPQKLTRRYTAMIRMR